MSLIFGNLVENPELKSFVFILRILVQEGHYGSNTLSSVDTVPRLDVVHVEVERSDVEPPGDRINETLFGVAGPDVGFSLVLWKVDEVYLLPQ